MYIVYYCLDYASVSLLSTFRYIDIVYLTFELPQAQIFTTLQRRCIILHSHHQETGPGLT